MVMKKSDNQKYNDVKKFIETSTSLELLRSMLVETIDNTKEKYYLTLYSDYCIRTPSIPKGEGKIEFMDPNYYPSSKLHVVGNVNSGSSSASIEDSTEELVRPHGEHYEFN